MKTILLTDKTGDETIELEAELAEKMAAKEIPDTVYVLRHPKVIYKLAKAQDHYIDPEQTSGLGIIRSRIFEGRETSIIVAGNGIGILAVLNDEGGRDLKLFMSRFYFEPIAGFCRQHGIETEVKGNDLVVAGTDRKVMGTVFRRLQGGVLMGHCMFSLSPIDYIDLDKLYVLPPEKFEGKTVSLPSERSSSLEKEVNKKININELEDYLVNYFSNLVW